MVRIKLLYLLITSIRLSTSIRFMGICYSEEQQYQMSAAQKRIHRHIYMCLDIRNSLRTLMELIVEEIAMDQQYKKLKIQSRVNNFFNRYTELQYKFTSAVESLHNTPNYRLPKAYQSTQMTTFSFLEYSIYLYHISYEIIVTLLSAEQFSIMQAEFKKIRKLKCSWTQAAQYARIYIESISPKVMREIQTMIKETRVFLGVFDQMLIKCIKDVKHSAKVVQYLKGINEALK